MRILSEVTSKGDLKKSDNLFDGVMVKGVVDVAKGILAVDAPMHADLEQMLLETGSRQDDLWGINLWLDDDEDFIEFDSMINIRPRQGNKTRGVDDEGTQIKIKDIVAKWVH